MNWEYNSTHRIQGLLYDVWQADSDRYPGTRDAYRPYTARMHQPGPVRIKPVGTGHYCGEDAVLRKLGIKVQVR